MKTCIFFSMLHSSVLKSEKLNCFFSYIAFPIPIWHSSIFLEGRNLKLENRNIMAIWLGIFFMLVPFFVIMVLESRRKRQIREEDEEVGYGEFDENTEEEEDYAEEEGGSGEHEATDTPTRQEQSQTPLWKYVQR